MFKLRKSVLILIAVVLITSMFVAACGSQDASSDDGQENNQGSKEKVVNLFFWSDSFPDSVIKRFEEETGIRVNLNTFSSNEEMLAKLSVGNSGYDVTVVTPNFAEVLIKEDMLEKINKENIPNLENIGSDFFGMYADPNNDYTVPYLWGVYILAVDEELTDVKVEGYEDLFNPEFENSLVLPDDPRPVIGGMLATLGYSPNSTNEEEILEAGELLKKLKPNIKTIDTDAKNLFVSKEVKAGFSYTGEIPLAKRENPDIKIVPPKDGLLVWLDSLVIPKDAPHKENAEIFINFINDPDVNKELILSYPYGTANVEAVKLLPDDIKEEIAFDEEYVRGEFLKDVGEATVIYDRVWTEFKQ